MASRRLVPASAREALLGIPSDTASLERNYLLADEDLDLIGTRRRPENRLGLAIHIALLRHPGQGWLDDTEPPAPLAVWLAEQIDVPFPALARYGSRGATRSSHRRLATGHLGLRAFVPGYDMGTAVDLAEGVTPRLGPRWSVSATPRRGARGLKPGLVRQNRNTVTSDSNRVTEYRTV